MKKFCSFALIILSMFSCVLFSACGGKYDNLKIDLYSSNGALLEEARFVIDDDNSSQTLDIKMKNIDEDDVGQVVVYSVPNYLVTVSEYTYNQNICSVKITPNISSQNGAKLVVSHLASGKKKEIPLAIEQKSNNVQIYQSKYVVSIPDKNFENRSVDLTKTYDLYPSGSTDKLYFKVDESVLVKADNSVIGYDGVKLIPLDGIDGFDKVYVGFEVSSSTAETNNLSQALKIYPVTFLKDYKEKQQIAEQDQYKNKTISVYFKNVLNEENVELVSETEVNTNNIQLIANDDKFCSFKFSLNYLGANLANPDDDKLLNEANFFDMYEIEHIIIDKTYNNKVSLFVDGMNDIHVTAHDFTDKPVEIRIILNPINFVGDVQPVELSISVKGELKSNKIEVSKNGEIISNKTNIFDYYESASSLGALFTFNPGENVHKDLNKMRIIVEPSILCVENRSGALPEGVTVNSTLYSLMFRLVDDYLKFTYSETFSAMVSEEIDSTTKVYIKYVNGDGEEPSETFSIKVRTINKSTLEHWKNLENTETTLDFTPIKGVKSMSLQAGYYYVDETDYGRHMIYDGATNLEYVYLNRIEGLDNKSEYINTNFIYVADNVSDADDELIDKFDFVVKIQPLKAVTNPLTLKDERCIKDADGIYNEGVQTLTYSYNKNVTNDVLGLVYRSDTSLGDYKITFYQEDIEKASVICRVYESLDGLNEEDISLETNKTAFKNENYQSQYSSDYIVASGQNLDISINLPQAVIDSNIISGYAFDYKIGLSDGSTVLEIVGEKSDYFTIVHDNENTNLAKLQFKKGTYVDDGPKYVYLTITIKEKAYDNIIIEAAELKETCFEISFFIYETINDNEVKINHTSLTRYPKEFMAIDYKNLSETTLEVYMASELWNYATSNDIVWNIDSNNISFDGDSSYTHSGVSAINYPEQNKCEFVFSGLIGYDSYTRIIKAYITQFDKIFEVQCIVRVENPIITESLVIESETFVTDDNEKTPYINLKKGESYQVLARNISSLGEVTNPEITIQVADEYGNAYRIRDYFEVNQTTSEIKVIDVASNNKFKLIVFAKDALKEVVSSDKSGYNMPSIFLMEDYSNAYFVIDIYLSDGSAENPYLIKNAYDFWEINETEFNKQAYYLLMTSLSLDDVKDTSIIKTINNFTGNISTYDNDIYTIDGIYLDRDMSNLFADFSGEISNIRFSVDYAYDIIESDTQYLGLFDSNNGTITNIGVYVRGYANLNGSATYYFGGLAGENLNTIEYKDDEDWNGIVGVDGSIQLKGDAKVYFGGLVGKNISAIIGCEKETTEGGENEIVLSVAGGRENTLSQLTINSSLANNSAIGGVVGLNTFGTNIGVIRNAFVQVTINAENTSNVGGVIGENSQDKTAITIEMSDYVVVDNSVLNALHEAKKNAAIYNVKSASTINAKDNVGGIVGLDSNGVYLECDYQILSQTYKEIALVGNNSVGGIAGKSNSGKFLFCSVMSYNWNYSEIKDEIAKVITDVADISGQDFVGGIVGSSTSETGTLFAGDNVINNRVVIISSSVNAYLQATKMDEIFAIGNIGGIHSSVEGAAVLYNAYFVGTLDGAVNYEEIDFGSNVQYLALDNNGSSHYNAVYTLNLCGSGATTTLKQGSYKDNKEFKIDSETDIQPFWWWNSNINGGYIFITNETERDDDTQPIFDLAPESIDVQVKEPKETGLERVLVLDYYDFSIAENLTDAKLLELIEKANRSQNITYLLNIIATPSNLGVVVINIKSTNSNVVDITYDGRILINGVGECELIFSSVLNPNAGAVENRTIKVVVDYPITDLHLSTSRTDKNGYVDNGSTQNIAQNSSRQYYAVTNGVYAYDGGEYKHKTKTNINFNVEIIYETANADFDITQYLAITGTKIASNKNEYFVDIDEKTPFMISVLKKLETRMFTATVTPYVTIKGVQVNVVEDSIKFNLSTLEGVTNVSFSYDEAIVYPNDIVYLNAYVSTDHKLKTDDVSDLINIISNDNKYSCVLNEENVSNVEYFVYKEESKIGSFVLYIDTTEAPTEYIQKIKLRLEFSDIYLEEELNIQLQFELGSGVVESVDYTILPQRINKIEIKNYYYKNIAETETQKVQQDILKPNSAGEMIIDIVPDNGYYDYLEISDITGSEEIVFIQVDENGNSLSLSHDPSSDGKGIKLYDYNLGKSRIYIRTQISNRYSSKMHTIEVRAYSANGTKIASNRKYVDVKMLPEIEVTYLLPDGRDSFVANSKNATVTGVYLANGVDANFRIKTTNANTEVERTITGKKYDDSSGKYVEDKDFALRYQLVKISDELYSLNCKTYNPDDVGKKLKLSFKVYSLLDNGDFDVAECSIEFTIASFVIHGVSVNSSIDNAKTTEIYGYYGREIDLEFYFDETDISFYNNNSFHNSVYMRGDTYDDTNKDLSQIYAILDALNSDGGTNQYLILNNNKKITESIKYEDVTPSNLILAGNKLTVQEDYTPKYLAIAFMLNYNNSYTKWTITTYDGATSDEGSYIVDKNYNLNFRNAVPMHEATVITSKEQFENMTSGGRYILDVDLLDDKALTAYTPIDADILEFDGNGHTIEIKSFATFNDVSLKAGLFAQIYPNMLVKNVKVIYSTDNLSGDYSFGYISQEDITYADICDPNVAYTDAKFGGIAAVNNGVITNCVVEGRIAISASVLEKKTFATGGNYEIDFDIGGLVCENTSTGYITNSTTRLEVAALANIGGFVHTNSGKIVSCGVEDSTTIYGYNVELGNTIIVDIAGFAVDNSGEISMSYVNLIKDEAFTTIDSTSVVHRGTMSAKDFSAGFVSDNKGDIFDAYVQMSQTGVNNNRFAGFVDTNSGNISRAYTYINSGIKASKDDSMFVGQNSGKLSNCIEFVVDNNNIKEDLSSINISYRNEKTCYEEHDFAFGDNVSAVWTIQAGTLPKLVSTQEFTFNNIKSKPIIIEPIEDTNPEDGIDENKYNRDPANYGTKENPFIIHDIETWNYYFNKENVINMLGYYRIVKDIDFSVVGDNPFTSNATFQGNIQGNNMKLNGIMLYSNEASTSNEISSIGLFKEFVGVNDKHVVNSVRNLTLNATSIWASSTNSVGVLAGIIEDFNLYNITIDAESVVMVGRNAVGGVAGLIRGEFDMDQISSNIGANSTRASTLSNYSIYISRNNSNDISYNLSKVYYAGSVAGILDGYDRTIYNVNNSRNIDKNYYKVQNITVNGEISLAGDTIGSAFGFVGEQVLVNKLTVNVSGLLSGSQYSGGAIGENRGVLKNAGINIADEIFKRSQYVSAGAVGFNLGGLVKNVEVTANIVKNDYSHTAGGIVGRNVNGTIATSHFDGEIFSYFAGGIVGANYSDEILTSATTGTGAIHGECKQNLNLIPSSQVIYWDNGEKVDAFAEVSLSLAAFNKMIENSSKCYSYKNDTSTNNGSLAAITVKSKVLGLVVGLSYETIINKTDLNETYTDDTIDDTYKISVNKNEITFNSSISGVEFKQQQENIVLKDEALDVNDVTFTFENVNVIDIDMDKPYVIYLVGSIVTSFDSWSNYSNEYVLIK